MLYIVLPPETAAWDTAFDAPLSDSGHKRAAYLANIFTTLGVEWVFTCPALRCLQTLKPYAQHRMETKGYLRTTAEYSLYPAIREATHMPRPLTWDELTQYHLKMQDADGMIVQPGETVQQLRQRVVDWFGNQFMEKYRDSPIPTAIICDPVVASVLVHYIMRRAAGADDSNQVVKSFVPGGVYEFGSDGIDLVFQRQV